MCLLLQHMSQVLAGNGPQRRIIFTWSVGVGFGLTDFAHMAGMYRQGGLGI